LGEKSPGVPYLLKQVKKLTSNESMNNHTWVVNVRLVVQFALF
jgi:hypothetical protein